MGSDLGAARVGTLKGVAVSLSPFLLFACNLGWGVHLGGLTPGCWPQAGGHTGGVSEPLARSPEPWLGGQTARRLVLGGGSPS